MSRSEALQTLDIEFKKSNRSISHPKHGSVVEIIEGERSRCAVLLLHGLYESPDSLKGLRKYFKSRGCDVVAPLLEGHWQKSESAAHQVRLAQWLTQTDHIFDLTKALHPHLIVVGFSFGGLLSYRLAKDHPQEIEQLILFAPALLISQKAFWGAYFGGEIGLSKNFRTGNIYDGIEVDYYPAYWGTEVVKLIQNQFGEEKAISWGKEKSTIRGDSYQTLKVPTFVSFTRNDDTVSSVEIENFVLTAPAIKKILVYSATSGIKHGNITRSDEDINPGDPKNWQNHLFSELLKNLDLFLDDAYLDRRSGTELSQGSVSPGKLELD